MARSIRGEQVEIVNGTVEKRHSLARARPRRAAVHGARRASLGKRRARAETGAMEEEKKYIKKKVRISTATPPHGAPFPGISRKRALTAPSRNDTAP